MKKTRNNAIRVMVLAAATAAVGCTSSKPHAQIDGSANQIEHNRILVRMALAENVYNGIATERAVYPKDFDYGGASLNPLGSQRVGMMIHACRQGTSRVVVIQGDESDALYAERVTTVRRQFADAGYDKDKIVITKGDHLDAGSSSERGLLSFDKMMSEYRPKEGGGGTNKSPSGTSDSMK